MSKIKEWTAKVHLGILDSANLTLLVLVGLLGWYEGYFLTEMTFQVYGKPPSVPDYISNYAPVLMASLLTMCVPVFLQHSKTKMSSGGIEISPLEMMVAICMIGGSMIVYGYIYFKTIEALDAVKSMGKITQQAYNLRVSTFTMTIGINLFIDFLLGLWSIYEVESHNDRLTTIKTGKYRKALINKNKKRKADEEEERKAEEEKKKTEEDFQKKYEEAMEDLKKKNEEQKELNLPVVVKT